MPLDKTVTFERTVPLASVMAASVMAFGGWSKRQRLAKIGRDAKQGWQIRVQIGKDRSK